MRTPFSGTEYAAEDVSFRTTCGRLIRVGLLTLGGASRPARRVSLDIGPTADRADSAWAGLTASEARELAAALLAQAAAADRRGRPLS
ncbi:MAG TPA: hypothetical protein VGN41_12355 [Streptosporangiaceae bacterium]|jgi:hypothetical protein